MRQGRGIGLDSSNPKQEKICHKLDNPLAKPKHSLKDKLKDNLAPRVLFVLIHYRHYGISQSAVATA